MLKFPSPLSGFSTPFGTHGALSAYAVGSFEPEFVLDFGQEYYRTGGTATTFDSAIVFQRISDATYVDNTGTIQTAAPGVARVGHHFWNGSEWEKGALFEPTGAVQLLHTTDTLVTQSHIVTAVPHTLHFTGTGTVTLSGASTAGPLVGAGTGEENRVSLTFTPTAASLTLTVSGTVTNAQLEVGSVPTSYIPNLAASGTVTRAADTLTVPAANLPWPTVAPLTVSIQMEGRMTYADNNVGAEASFVRWQFDSANRINTELQTNVGTGRIAFYQSSSGALDAVAGGSYSPGVNVPFNIASRHGSTFINGAVDGTALTADTTPTALPDLSTTDLNLAYSGGPMILKKVRIWAADIGDDGIAEASA